jgi:arylsulfatase A-like enzyme
VRNVVWLMSDQHTWRAAGAYGNVEVRTPTLDRLAREGMRFDCAYTPSPVCVPARFALLTGRYPHTTGCTGNATPLPLRERTAAHWFRERGYLTAFVGKLHPVAPHTAGFDYYVDAGHYFDYLGPRTERFVRGLGARNSGCAAPWIDTLHEGRGNPWGQAFPDRPSGAILPLEDHFDSFVAREAVRFLRAYAGEPFLLVVSFLAPHAPFAPAPEFDVYDPAALTLPETAAPVPDAAALAAGGAANLHPYGGWFLPPPGDARRDEEARRWLAAYYGNVTQTDAAAGAMLEALDTLGLAGDTLVVYTTDHGEMMYEHGLFGKTLFYEGSARVPLIVRCPGAIAPGTACAAPVDLTDVLPSSLDLAGIPYRASGGDASALDGYSLVPAFGGAATGRAFAFSEIGFPHHVRYMLRDARWKYTHHAGDQERGGARGGRLFDLRRDPDERDNLIDDVRCAPVAAALREQLLSWLPPQLPR